jgi:hypothetical protein
MPLCVLIPRRLKTPLILRRPLPQFKPNRARIWIAAHQPGAPRTVAQVSKPAVPPTSKSAGIG